MHAPREPHLNLIKRLLHYLQGTINLDLMLHSTYSNKLVAYSDDADRAGCSDTCRSISDCKLISISLVIR